MSQAFLNLDPKNHERIANAIGFILNHYQDQPRLEDIADQAGLSSWHFNRLFRHWAGVTPKQLVRFLSLRAAKESLDKNASVLSASLSAGLSGPGRLHDLFVSIEAMTPGEYKNGGTGLALSFGFSHSPFGDVLLAVTSRGVSHLAFVDRGKSRAIDELRKAWPNASLKRDDAGMTSLARKIFSGEGEAINLRLKGTNFQIQVWRALLRIPSGNQTSYSDLARTIDRPKSHRAVANAVGKNPVAWLIPCHRVLRASGALGGYRWGVNRKAEILTWELAQQV